MKVIAALVAVCAAGALVYLIVSTSSSAKNSDYVTLSPYDRQTYDVNLLVDYLREVNDAEVHTPATKYVYNDSRVRMYTDDSLLAVVADTSVSHIIARGSLTECKVYLDSIPDSRKVNFLNALYMDLRASQDLTDSVYNYIATGLTTNGGFYSSSQLTLDEETGEVDSSYSHWHYLGKQDDTIPHQTYTQVVFMESEPLVAMVQSVKGLLNSGTEVFLCLPSNNVLANKLLACLGTSATVQDGASGKCVLTYSTREDSGFVKNSIYDTRYFTFHDMQSWTYDGVINNQPFLIRQYIGSAYLTICATPALISNYAFVDPKASAIAMAIADCSMKTSEIRLVQYVGVRSRDRRSGRNPFDLGTEAMAAMFWSFTCAGLIYALAKGRRRQRMIPVVLPVENVSVDFSSNIGLLYYKYGSNSDVQSELIRMLRLRMYVDLHIPRNAAKQEVVGILTKVTELLEVDALHLLEDITLFEAGVKPSNTELIDMHNRHLKFHSQFAN